MDYIIEFYIPLAKIAVCDKTWAKNKDNQSSSIFQCPLSTKLAPAQVFFDLVALIMAKRILSYREQWKLLQKCAQNRVIYVYPHLCHTKQLIIHKFCTIFWTLDFLEHILLHKIIVMDIDCEKMLDKWHEAMPQWAISRKIALINAQFEYAYL